VARGESIALGTATDPYQPAERRYCITRSMLGVFATVTGFRLGVTTKSDLIVRDIDLLCESPAATNLSIHMTITTVDRELARLLEPMAPRPDLRLAAVRALTDAGLRVVVFLRSGAPADQRQRGEPGRARPVRGRRRRERLRRKRVVPETVREAGLYAVSGGALPRSCAQV